MPRFNSLEPRLHIADFARSLAFYRDVVGFEILALFPEPDPTFALMAKDGVGLQIGGPDAKKTDGSTSSVTLYFDVADANGVYEQVKNKVKVEWGPEVYVYQRREFAFHDPDGHLIIISEETDDPVTRGEA